MRYLAQAVPSVVRTIGGREIARFIAATPLERSAVHDACRHRLSRLPFAEQFACKAELARIRKAQRGLTLAEITTP